MGMRPNCHNGQLCIPGDHSRQGGAAHPHVHGKDKDVIQYNVCHSSGDHSVHRQFRGAVIADKGLEIGREEKRAHSPNNIWKIFHDIGHGLLGSAEKPGDIFHVNNADYH